MAEVPIAYGFGILAGGTNLLKNFIQGKNG